jgi:hypothetical protein
VVGVYVPSDPQAASEAAQQGRIGFDYGTFFQKGQAMGTGQPRLWPGWQPQVWLGRPPQVWLGWPPPLRREVVPAQAVMEDDRE